MIEKKSIKKEKSTKNKCTQKEVVGGFFKIYTAEGWKHLLHLWQEGNRFSLSRSSFHSKECRRVDIILSRNECEWLLLSLQYQLGRESLRIRNKIRGRKGKRVIRPQAKKRQME